MPERSDESLMSAYQAGDADAFELLYVRHKAALLRYIFRLVADRATAEELFQEVWLNLIKARTRYRATARFSTYLYTLAHNRVVDYLRRRPPDLISGFHPDAPEQGPSGDVAQACRGEADDPASTVETAEQSEILLGLVQRLPPDQREAVLLKEYGGLSLAEIAAVTSVGTETVKSRLRYAFAKLRKNIIDQ